MKRAAAILLANAALSDAAHPIRMIVTTLKEMQEQLSTDEVEDKKLYDRMQCWCKKTMPQLNDAISKNRDLAKQETAASEAAAAAAKKLSEEIKVLKEKIETESKALSDANDQRSKDADAFNAQQAELTQAISANQQAIEVLSKHQQEKQTGVQGPVEFLQAKESVSAPQLEKVATTIKRSLQRVYTGNSQVSISASQRAALNGFLQQPTFGAYQSASSQIFGILESMLEEFQRDLSDETKTENEAVEAHSKMVAIKEKLIADFKASVEKKTNQQAGQEKTALESAATAEEATAAGEADAKSLEATTTDCQTNIKDYNQRSEDRAREQKGVATAIEYLDSDEARDLFRDTSATFIQLGESSEQKEQAKARESARKILQEAGSKNHSAKLLVLAQTLLRGGVFDKIILAINELEKELKATKVSDQEEFDTCTASINDMKTKLSELGAVIATETDQVQNAADAIARLSDEIKGKNEEIAAIETDMKDEGYMRETASSKFAVDYSNNQAAIHLLEKTIAALGEAYGFVEEPARADTQEKPADFQKFEKNASGNTVVTALEKIKNDITKSMDDAVAQETSENEAYANTVATLSGQVKACKAQRTELKAQLVEEERVHQSTSESLEAHESEEKSGQEALKGKQSSCRFIMENLDIRKTHHDSEIQALQQAREFLKNTATQMGA